jgi:hypothetical protein
MADIHFECPKCAQPIDAPQELANQLIDCPTCKETIEVPRRSRPSWTIEVLTKTPPKPAAMTPAAVAILKFKLPPIEESWVSRALTIIAALELIGSLIGGLIAGSDNTETGWLVFLGGFISGLILLGFARVIQNTFESSQRLERLEMLMERSYDDKNAA